MKSDAWQVAFIVFLSLAAVAVRLIDIGDLPLNFHPARQYHGLLIARGIYYDWYRPGPAWKENLARLNRRRAWSKELPVQGMLIALAWRLAGQECIFLPRVLCALVWVGGGILLFLLARAISPPPGPFIAAAFYLFLPFGIAASRAIMPDPMMIALLVGSLYSQVRYHLHPSGSGLIAAFPPPVCRGRSLKMSSPACCCLSTSGANGGKTSEGWLAAPPSCSPSPPLPLSAAAGPGPCSPDSSSAA